MPAGDHRDGRPALAGVAMNLFDRIKRTPVPAWMLAYIARTKEPKTFAQIHAETDATRPVHEVWRALDSAMRNGLLACHDAYWAEYFPIYHPPGMEIPRKGLIKNAFKRPVNLHARKRSLNNGKGTQPPGAEYPA